MAAPTLVDLPSAEVKRRYAALSDEDKTRATTLKRNGRSPAEAVQIIEAQNAAYMGQQPAAEQARARGDVGEAALREAAAAALGAGQMLSMGADKAVMDAVQWAKKNPVAAAYVWPALPAAGALGLLGDNTEYRQQVEKIQQDAPGAAQRGMAVGIFGDLLTGGGAAKQMGKAALEQGGKGVMRLIRAGAKPAAQGAAAGFVGGAAGGEGDFASRLESGATGALVGGGLAGAFGALPTAAAMALRPKSSAPTGPGIVSTAKEAVQAAGGLGNLAKRQLLKKIPLVGDELADIAAPKPKVEAVKPSMVVESAPAAPVPEAPTGPVQMPALPREARAAPLPEPTAVKVTPEMVVESGPSTAMRVQKLGEENTWIGRALQHGVPPEQIAKGSGLPVEDVQAFAKMQRTNPEAGPVAADAPLPAPMPEPAPSPFARAQPAQPPQPRPFDPLQPVSPENLPPGMSAKRWAALTGQQQAAPAPFLSTPSPRPSAPPSEATAAGRVPAAPKEPSPVEMRDAAIEKFDAVRRARQALRGTAQTIGEQSPTWLNAVLDELRTNPNIRPEEIRRVTDRMIAEGYDPHLIQQAIAARRGQELEGLADISRLTGKTMKENLVAQAIASGAKTADEIAEMTGLNLAEVELLTGRHDVLVPRGVPKPEPTRPTPINPAPLDESGERVFAPAYKEIFGEPHRSSKLTAEERLARLPPGVGEGQMKEILRLRSGMGSEGVPLKPQQIAERLKIPPPVVRFILKERGENLPRISLMKGGPEAPAFDEGAKVMGRGAIPGNVQRIKLLQNDKARLAKFLDELRAVGWTQAQIDGMMSQATSPAPLKVRKRKPPE